MINPSLILATMATLTAAAGLLALPSLADMGRAAWSERPRLTRQMPRLVDPWDDGLLWARVVTAVHHAVDTLLGWAVADGREPTRTAQLTGKLGAAVAARKRLETRLAQAERRQSRLVADAGRLAGQLRLVEAELATARLYAEFLHENGQRLASTVEAQARTLDRALAGRNGYTVPYGHGHIDKRTGQAQQPKLRPIAALTPQQLAARAT